MPADAVRKRPPPPARPAGRIRRTLGARAARSRVTRPERRSSCSCRLPVGHRRGRSAATTSSSSTAPRRELLGHPRARPRRGPHPPRSTACRRIRASGPRSTRPSGQAAGPTSVQLQSVTAETPPAILHVELRAAPSRAPGVRIAGRRGPRSWRRTSSSRSTRS